MSKGRIPKSEPVIEFYKTFRRMPNGRRRKEYGWRQLSGGNRKIRCGPCETFTTIRRMKENLLAAKYELPSAPCRWAKPRNKRRR